MNTSSRGVPEELKRAVGGGVLLEDTGSLNEYGEACYPVEGLRPGAAVKVSEAGDVAAVVRAARDHGVNLVPVSSGPPHRKGGAAPASDGVVVDLSGMKQFLHFDRRNKVAVIEPGVTFDELRARAKREGLRPLSPLLPRENKSVVASYLEKQPITIPKYHWDTTDPLLCVEVVFGTGDVFRTGSAAGPGTLEEQWAKGNAQKNPMGPAATDILKLVQGAQGTMGIVTWASVKLELDPAVRRFRFVVSDGAEPLLCLAREMLRRKLADELLLLDRVNLARCLADVGISGKGKWKVDDPFVMVYAVAGYEGLMPEERAEYQERDIEELARGLGFIPRAALGEISGEDAAEVFDGTGPPGLAAHGGGAGREVFFLTTMDRVPAFVEVVRRAASHNGVDPGTLGVYVQPVLQGRACHLEFDIYYDPGDSAAAALAGGAAAEASAQLAGSGAFFSRPYEPWVELAYEKCPDTVDALRRVKGVFDPADIMNRGKLCFGGGESDDAR